MKTLPKLKPGNPAYPFTVQCFRRLPDPLIAVFPGSRRAMHCFEFPNTFIRVDRNPLFLWTKHMERQTTRVTLPFALTRSLPMIESTKQHSWIKAVINSAKLTKKSFVIDKTLK
ncbi:hypothetical protein ACFOWZ_44630 [Lentzea rhizosphaerae]|uniref:Uncharacterized protein n=1 Tax=Lentzea rhizosphaerae TaxID=2041025 RepID=A0ABV8C9F7_9PSEU